MMQWLKKSVKGAVKTLPVVFSLADHEFIWAWPQIRFCQMLEGEFHIKTADFNQISNINNVQFLIFMNTFDSLKKFVVCWLILTWYCVLCDIILIHACFSFYSCGLLWILTTCHISWYVFNDLPNGIYSMAIHRDHIFVILTSYIRAYHH